MVVTLFQFMSTLATEERKKADLIFEWMFDNGGLGNFAQQSGPGVECLLEKEKRKERKWVKILSLLIICSVLLIYVRAALVFILFQVSQSVVKSAAAYQLGNTSSRTITEVKQR